MFKFLRRRKHDAAAAAAPEAGAAAHGTQRLAPAGAHAALHGNAETLLQRLEWTVIRRLDGMLQGDYRTLLRGFGLDLADLREYQPQDDVRYIDWNVTARLGVPHVREFQEDREVTAWFLLDLSGSIDFGSREVKKRDLAAELTGVLARLLTRHGNRVGAVLKGTAHDTHATVIPVRGGRRQVLHLLDSIRRLGVRDAATATTPGGVTTDLAAMLREAHGAIKRRSVVFVLSDFISTPGWEVALAQLARRHEVIAVRLYDPVEQALPELGFVMLQDAETGEQLFLDTQDRGFRERFVALAQEREAALRAAFAQSGVDCMELATTDNLPQELLRFIDLRKRRSRLTAGGLREPLVAALRA
jgi:uncharacterized protein (DUF58 family)